MLLFDGIRTCGKRRLIVFFGPSVHGRTRIVTVTGDATSAEFMRGTHVSFGHGRLNGEKERNREHN